MRFTKQRISLKKAGKIHSIFHEYAPTLPYYSCVKFELILLVNLNNISCVVRYTLYSAWVSIVDDITSYLHILKQ